MNLTSSEHQKNRLLIEFFKQGVDYDKSLQTVIILYQEFVGSGSCLYLFVEAMPQKQLRKYVSFIIEKVTNEIKAPESILGSTTSDLLY